MRNLPFSLIYGVILMSGMVNPIEAQNNSFARYPASQQLQHMHSSQSIDQELARLTRDLELTPQQRLKVRPLLEEHHDKLQALFDKNPGASRQELGPQIHAISDETHREIHALLTDHQRELERAMQQRENNGEEKRQSIPATTAPPNPPL